MRDDDEVDIRHSDDMQDLISTVPPALLRWGITLLMVILVLILSLTALVHYPDVIKTRIIISRPDSFGSVTSRAPGKVHHVLVAANQYVMPGQPLVYIQSKDSGNYRLTAPISGKVKVISITHRNATARRNQLIFEILPGNQHFVGQITLPGSVIERVRIGQWVLIKLKMYSAERLSLVKGRIKNIKKNLNNLGDFTAEVELENSFANKSRHLILPISAEANIITGNEVVLRRILRNILTKKP